MSDWTCDKVEGWIDLYAAGEADGPTRAAVGRHLKACPACAESHQHAQQLLGLLDQGAQESERLERLWSRLGAEPVRARRPASLRLWRAAALAASVLVAVGLSGWLGLGGPGESAGPQVAVLKPAGARFAPRGPEAMMAPGMEAKEVDAGPPGAAEDEVVYTLDLAGKTPDELRRGILAAARAGEPSPPPEVNLEVTIPNTGRGLPPLDFAARDTELVLDLQGPGVVRVAASHAPAPLARLKTVVFTPGDSYVLQIRKLAERSPGAVHYLYWTEPGEYTLTVRLRVMAADPLAGRRCLRGRRGRSGCGWKPRP